MSAFLLDENRRCNSIQKSISFSKLFDSYSEGYRKASKI